MTFRQRPGSGRSLSGPVQGFDLDEELARLREEKEWQEGALPTSSPTSPSTGGGGRCALAS